MSIVGGDPAHGHVGHIEEGDLALVYFEFFLLEEVEIEQFSVLLAIVALQIQVFLFFELHLAFFLHDMLQQPPRGRADIPKIIDRQRIVTPNYRVIHVFYICLLGLRLDIVGESPEFLIELSNLLNLV